MDSTKIVIGREGKGKGEGAIILMRKTIYQRQKKKQKKK